MKKMSHSLFVAFLVYFFSHIVFYLSFFLGYGSYGYNGFIGSVIYGLIYTFWAYWLLTYIYIQTVKKDVARKPMYLKSAVIISVGYVFARIPDIIDSHFLHDFKWVDFLVFFLFIPVLTELELLFRKKQ